jgi:D-tyrosyl-tRNA(Tyr) deacylase
MRVILQRVTRARVSVDNVITGEISRGLVLLVAAGQSDTLAEAELLADKVANLRVFADAGGKFNLSGIDTGAEMLVVSQFTLFADCRKGRRPSFIEAARPEVAEPLIEAFAARLKSSGLKVASGVFQADMLVEIHNDGPVTIALDTDQLPRVRK